MKLPPVPRGTASISALLGLYAFTGGLLSIGGWVLDLPFLTDWVRHGISIQPNAALASLLGGGCLVGLAYQPRAPAVRWTGIGIAVLGLTTLFEHFTRLSLGLDVWFLFGRTWGSSGTVAPGRMGIPASVSFTLIGSALSLASRSDRLLRKYIPVLGLATVMLASFSLVGFAFGANLLFTLPHLTTISLQAATFLLALGLGLVIAVPQHEPMVTLLENSTAGLTARRLAPILLLLPLVLGWLSVRGEAVGLYDSSFGSALRTVVEITLFSFLLWRAARAVGARERALAAANEERLAAQLKLRSSEARAAATLENMKDGFRSLDSEMRFTFFNEAACQMFSEQGLDATTFIGKKIFDVFPEGINLPGGQALLRCFQERVPVEIENYFPTWKRWYIAKNYPTPDGGVSTIFVDVTERKRAEQELQSSEARLRGLKEAFQAAVSEVPLEVPLQILAQMARGQLTGSPRLAFCTMDPDGTCLHPIHGVGQMPEQFLQTIDSLKVGADSAPCGLAVHSGMPVIVKDAQGDAYCRPWLPLLREYEIRAVWSFPIQSSSGKAVGSLGIYFDQPQPAHERDLELASALTQAVSIIISRHVEAEERKRVAASLRSSEERYRSLVSVITDVIWTADAHGQIVASQPAWERYTGQKSEEYLGNGWVQSMHPEDRERLQQAWQRASNAGLPYQEQGRVWHDETQSYRYFEVRATPLRNAEGVVQEWVGTCTDVHQRKQAELELRAADRQKDEFLAMLAHELRNPLAPVMNSLEILKRAEGDPALIQQGRAIMERQILQLTRLVDDLLDVSRISRNKLELKTQRADLAEIVAQGVEASRPLADALGQQLIVNLPATPVWMMADPVRLTQVIGNLLNNASKYTDRGGRLRLSVEPRDETVVITVEDNGVGISPEMLPRVFEMFTQIDRTIERSRGGLGIGLSLVKRLVELHGGSVTAQSDGLGRGSTFVVHLPRLKESPTAETSVPPPAPSSLSTTSRRVLVVDDNLDAARSLSTLLKLGGNLTQSAHDGLAAVHQARDFRPEVILLDIGLPKMNGYEVCRTIRELPGGKEIVIIALTGWGQYEDRRKSEAAGFNGHLVKPVDYTALLKLLDDLHPAAV